MARREGDGGVLQEKDRWIECSMIVNTLRGCKGTGVE